MTKLFSVISLLLIVSFLGCASTNMKTGELPSQNQGIAFACIEVQNVDKASKIRADIFWKGSNTTTASELFLDEKETLYPVILDKGEYEFAYLAVRYGVPWVIGPLLGLAPSFTVIENKINYIGTYKLIVSGGKYQFQQIKNDENYSKAIKNFEQKNPDLAKKYNLRNAITQ